MANSVKLTINVSDDGSLNVVAKNAQKAAKATDNLTRATDAGTKTRNRYNKAEKGVGGLTNNSTKAFAKQAGVINSGLVPAYATLAANVFAISAAFGVLSRAAEVKTLEEGFNRLANTVGQTSSIIVQSLQDITDGALSMDASLRAAAAGFSAGFDTSEISGLAKIATDASKALGRDLSDSVDRLIRGVGKLEPEILDELGIFVRLDDAAEKYAQSLGVAASDLTQAERRQAFMNETLEQGARKFGAMGDSVDVNPYAKLAAQFENLTHAILGFVNTALGPLIGLLGNNMVSLLGVLTLFGSGVAKAAIPSLTKLGEVAQQSAEHQKTLALEAAASAEKQVKAARKAVKSVDLLNKKTAFGGLQKKIGAGKASTDELKNAIKSLTLSEERRARNIEKNRVKNVAAKQEELKAIRALKRETELLLAAQTGNLAKSKEARQAGFESKREGDFGGAIDKINMGGPIEGFRTANKELGKYNKRLAVSMARQGKYSKDAKGLLGVLKNAPFIFRAAGAGARIFGAALINAIPFIGQIIFLAGLLLEGLIALASKISFTSKSMEQFNKVTDTAKEKTKQLNETNSGLKQGFLDIENGILLEAAAKLESAEAAQEYIIANRDAATATAENNAKVQTIQNSYKVAAGITTEFTEALKGFSAEMANADPGPLAVMGQLLKNFFGDALSASIQAVSSAFEVVSTKITEVKESIKSFITEGIDKFAETFPTIAENLGIVVSAGRGALDAVGDVAQGVLDTISEGVTGAIDYVAQGYQGLQDQAALDKFVSQTESQLDKLKDSVKGDATLSGILDEFIAKLGDGGVAGAMETAMKNGASFEEAMAIVTATLSQASNQINKTNRGLNEFEEQFKATQGIVQTFTQSFEKKNPYKELSDSLGQTIRQFKLSNEAAKDAGLTFEEFVDKNSSDFETLFKSFGIGVEELKVLGQEGPAALESLSEKVKEAVDLFDTMKDRVSEAKEAIKTLKADFEFQQAETAFLRLKEAIQKGLDPRQLTSDSAAQAKEDYDVKVAFIKAEGELRKKVIEEEMKLQQKVLEIRLAMSGIEGPERERIQGLIDSLDDNISARMQSVDQSVDTAILKEQLGLLTKQEEIRKNLAGSLGDGSTGTFAERAATAASMDYSLNDPQTGEELDSGRTEKIQALKELTSGMVEDLKALGPEGMVMAAVAEAGFTIAESFDNVFDKFEAGAGKMETFGAVAAATAASIGAINQIQQQQSQAAIGKIDEQIAAEKKRDGKSKESLAKIAALEKKKEAMEKKAFERNKKMQMAQTIANTAAGIMGVLSGVKDPIFTMPLALAQVGIIAAMGAAQLAVIAGTSFNGGGSAPSAGGQPSSISLGQRQSSVDLAKAKSARGELAYFRGEQGVGGPESFRATGAFAGYKNRAAGGNTAFMVGEQGPELFVPETPGTIVPNDDTQAASPTNVTFSINTIDASGVEDLLVAQRGNIIGMIRQAANSYGQDFVEEVDTSVFTQSSGGVNRY